MTENVAPTNIVASTSTQGKHEQNLSSSKPIQVEQFQTIGASSSYSRPVMHEQEHEQQHEESTMEKLKNMAMGGGQHKQEESHTGPLHTTTNIPLYNEEKHDESCETTKDTPDHRQIIEVLGEGWTDLRINLIPGMEASGIHVKSWNEDASTRIRHILFGANILEMVANQQKYIHALNTESLYCVTIPKRSEHHEKKFIPQGYALCWEFTLESHDVEFILKELIQDGAIVRHTVIAKHLCQAGMKMQGKWEVTGDTTVILAWNNSYSRFTSKKINFRMALVNV